MKVTFYLKSGNKLTTRFVKEFNWKYDGDLNITSYNIKYNTIFGNSIRSEKNFHVVLGQVEAIIVK